MAEEKKEGWLSKIFWGAAKLVTIGVVAAVAWQIFLDPLFFPLFHDTTNLVAQAWVMKMNSMFGWIPQATGLAKQPGLLTPLMKGFLSKEMNLLTPVPEQMVEKVFPQGISPEDLVDAVPPPAGMINKGVSLLDNFSWDSLNPLNAVAPALGMA